MTQFLGTIVNKLDSKGRVSVPAGFRSALDRLGGDLVLRPSHSEPCIECWPQLMFERLAEQLDRLPAFSAEQADLAHSLFARAHACRHDAEGRILLPETMVAHAQLSGTVAFVGLGRVFQLWDPAAAERRTQGGAQRAREQSLTLPPNPEPRA